jgi:hypothetical protein
MSPLRSRVKHDERLMPTREPWVGASVSARRVAAPAGSCPFAPRQTFAC